MLKISAIFLVGVLVILIVTKANKVNPRFCLRLLLGFDKKIGNEASKVCSGGVWMGKPNLATTRRLRVDEKPRGRFTLDYILVQYDFAPHPPFNLPFP